MGREVCRAVAEDPECTLVAAVAIVLGNLLADLVTPLIDPRIRLR